MNKWKAYLSQEDHQRIQNVIAELSSVERITVINDLAVSDIFQQLKDKHLSLDQLLRVFENATR